MRTRLCPPITRRSFFGQTAVAAAAGFPSLAWGNAPDALPGTQPLTEAGDFAAQMVAGIDRFLYEALAGSITQRQRFWKPDYSSPEAYTKSVEPNRQRLRKIIGAVDERKAAGMEYLVRDRNGPIVIAKGDGYSVYEVRWPVFEGVDGEGLLLQPDKAPVARIVALPDADWTPEMVVGMAPGIPPESQFARRLAENSCQVIVPALIDRKDTWSGNPKIGRMTNQPHREFIYRMAYEMGRHIIGYEVQKVLAALDWFEHEKPGRITPIAVAGFREGGLLALLAAALDTRIQATWIAGFWIHATKLEPIYRNLWSLSDEFGGPELAALVLPRALVLALHTGPSPEAPPSRREGRSGAAPGYVESGYPSTFEKEWEQLKLWCERLRPAPKASWVIGKDPKSVGPISRLLEALQLPFTFEIPAEPRPVPGRHINPALRLKRQFDQLVEHTQRVVRQAETRRKEFFWNKVPVNAGLAPAARQEEYEKSCESLRNYFWEEVMGKLPDPTLPANARSRLLYDEPKYKAYEVRLDVYADVFAYGILCVPKNLKEGERRPVVVCQHGLEGRPTDVVSPKKKTPYYNSFGSQLADRGYVIFAPQNPYIGQDKFRVLQRKANPLKLSLFSFIIRQHERILDWLATLPFVDPKRMAFYGLSYGGKTAMRVPAILKKYCLSICSADFNEWIWKNTSVDYPGSYMFSGEYEMPEFDLGNTFNYAEMAALIAPRPFMVERGHDDGVGIDEWVAYEYAKVRRHYAKLGIPERTAIEFFNDGHEINGKGTFEFLQRHLGWPKNA